MISTIKPNCINSYNVQKAMLWSVTDNKNWVSHSAHDVYKNDYMRKPIKKTNFIWYNNIMPLNRLRISLLISTKGYCFYKSTIYFWFVMVHNE